MYAEELCRTDPNLIYRVYILCSSYRYEYKSAILSAPKDTAVDFEKSVNLSDLSNVCNDGCTAVAPRSSRKARFQ